MSTPHQTGFGTGVLEDTIVEERTQPTDNGDHERFSHYVPKDKLMEAMVNGTPVIALCGKVWVPSRDPQRFPVCPSCKEIWETMSGGGDGDGAGNGDRAGGGE
ncbi:Protein of unknown function [Nocardioides scoriae]|uniref:DUF3039 domain-containing protein n=1 Tax=Nocardioides scoriae TaxID=642780 RepID=A0A1H1LE01_9ACTN|nr:DUF3039 domain-containing protein [Nocardioides scoriae]SDR72109.1 Protein of unknown function [Nocardioides scoriae]